MKVPPLVQILAAGGLAWGLSEGLPVWQFDGALVTAGVWIASIAGAGFLAIALNIFRIHKTTLDPLNPSKAQKLVVSGLYRITRNPMYVGMAFLLLGWCLYLGDVIAFLAIALFVVSMNHLQIKAEESALQDNFGDDYLRYTQRVRRWL